MMALVALALLLRLWHVDWGLPAVYEEAMPMNVAWQMWNWDGNGLDFHPRTEHKEQFFVYPALTFYLHFLIQAGQFLAGRLTGIYPTLAAFRTAFETDPTLFALIARLLTIGFDVGSVVVVCRIGVRFFSPTVGFVSAFLVALNPLHLRQAHLINVDTPLTFFVVLSTYFFLKLIAEPTRRSYLWAGLAAGAATATKYNGALLFAVLIGVHTLRSHSFMGALRGIRDRKLLLSLAAGIGVFLVTNPYVLLSFSGFVKDLSEVRQHMELGHLTADPGRSALSYYLFTSLSTALGWGLFLLTILGVVLQAARKDKRGLVLVGFPLLYGATLMMQAINADRYALPLVPVLVVLGVLGLLWIIDMLALRLARLNGGRSRSGAVLVGSLILALPSAGSVLAYQRTHSLPDTRTVTLDWIRKNIRPRSAIASGPFMIHIPEDVYFTLAIPFNAGASEENFVFYNTAWYEDLDLVVTSDYDYTRYKADPARFREILPFYDTLKTSWRGVFAISPAENQAGYTFWLYAPPRKETNDAFDSTLIRRLMASTNGLNFMGKLGLNLAVKGKNVKAAQLLSGVLALDPANATARRSLALVYFQLGRVRLALEIAEPYLRMHPNDPQMQGAAGNAMLSLGRNAEAGAHLTSAVQYGSRAEQDYVNLAMILAEGNELQKAYDVLARYLQMLPKDGPKAKLVQETMASIKSAMGPSAQ